MGSLRAALRATLLAAALCLLALVSGTAASGGSDYPYERKPIEKPDVPKIEIHKPYIKDIEKPYIPKIDIPKPDKKPIEKPDKPDYKPKPVPHVPHKDFDYPVYKPIKFDKYEKPEYEKPEYEKPEYDPYYGDKHP